MSSYEKEWRVFKHFLHAEFVHDLNRYEWSDSLKKIKMHDTFNSAIDKVKWPNSIETLQFGLYFDQPVENVIWPSSLKTLIFGNNFNQRVENIKWPKNLNVVHFGNKFNQMILDTQWPEETTLVLTDSNENTINHLPQNLKYLKINYLNCPLINLPITLRKLDILFDDNNYLEMSKIPYNCEINIFKK